MRADLSFSGALPMLVLFQYASQAVVVPLKSVAKVTKELPREWVEGVNDIKKEFRYYCMPLTGGITMMADLVGHKADPPL